MMENHLLKKDFTEKSKEKNDFKKEILVKKRINLLSHLSLTKSPNLNQINLLKKKNQKNNDENNNYQEIKQKKIVFKKNTDDKKKILGQIITDFSSNKKLNNNIFDDGNQLTLNPKEKENNIDFNNNIINNNLTININEEKEKDDFKNKNKFKKENKNNIQEIKIKNFNTKVNPKNISQKTLKLSISTSRGHLFKKRPFYIVGINNINKKINNEIDNSNKIGISNKFSNKVTSPSNILNSQNLFENIRKRNKNYSQINSITYNNNLNYNKNDDKDDEDKEKNKINNINNINNNISLNNRYNFYIKIGKNNKIDIKKDNKDINCEIKLTSPNREYKYKEDISPHFIKKLIVKCGVDKLNKINKNITLNKPSHKGINVNIKPLYKKIEIEKILVSNNNNNTNTTNNNNETKNKRANSYNKKSFKFLIHQAYNNRDLCTSFNRYYKSGQVLKERNLSIKNNNKNNNDSLNYSNSYLNSESNRPLGLNYNTDKKEKKYQNFYKSFRNIGRIRKKINLSYEENNNNKDIKKNLTFAVNDNNNNNNINSKKNNTNNNNLELTPLSPESISITNENEDKINKKVKTHRMVYSMEGIENNQNQNQIQINTPIPESRLIHSKINTSFSTDNSNLNSISSTYNNINNINNNNTYVNKNKNISSINSSVSVSNNLSISFINLEIIYVLEEKLKIIIEKIKNDKNSSKECYDFINYYFSHNFYNDHLRIFNSGKNRKEINNYIKYELLCYFLCYDISFKDEFKQTEILIKSIFNLLHQNFLYFLALIISNYKNKDNNIIILLNKIVKDNDINYKIIDENKYINIIENNLIKLIDYCKMIIENIYMKYLKGKNKYIQFPDSLNFINPISLDKNQLDILIANFFVQAFKSTCSEYNYDFLKKFFYSFLNHKQVNNIIKENNNNNNNNNIINNNDNEIESTPKSSKSKSNISINISENKNNNKNKNNNYYHYLLPKIKNNKYTLVLDLDETLIYTQKNYFYNKGKSNTNTVILRPGLLEFLHDMKPLFELVIFSSGTPDYVDPILKMVEKNEKFFDYILYRQHITTDDNGDNIKNLNLIGRDLKNVIIIDDISKYFKLQKANGICIKPFCGNILSDRKTLKTLDKVLQQIRIDVDKTRDIRISLDKYKHLLYPVVCNENENENENI